METTELMSPSYWENGIDIRLNPSLSIDTGGVHSELISLGFESAVVLATSGSGGDPKMVVLSKQAILASAEAVNRHCGIIGDDIWLGGLSTFHVGGLGIYARAFLSGSEVRAMAWDRWTRDGSAFLQACQAATLTSLTPIHLHDLVAAEIRSPPSLRGVFIGGGHLRSELAGKASALGWPIWPTYGMTETCSQVATSLEGDPQWLPVLPHWETRLNKEGRLQLRGAALLEGYLIRDRGTAQWIWNPARDHEGFYTTGDRVELRQNRLSPLGRSADTVKVLGELVSIEGLERSLPAALIGKVVVLAIPHERNQNALIAVVEGEGDEREVAMIEQWNDSLPAFQQMQRICHRESFPRTGAGKIDRVALRESLLDA